MKYLGDFQVKQPVRFRFNTVNISGIPTSLTSPNLATYKDNNAAESTIGFTVTTDFDSRTGLNLIELQTSGDPTFFTAGSEYFVCLISGTVNSLSVVGTDVAHFSISNRVDTFLGVYNSGQAVVNNNYLVWDSGNTLYISGKVANSTYSNSLDLYISGQLAAGGSYNSALDTWISGNINKPQPMNAGNFTNPKIFAGLPEHPSKYAVIDVIPSGQTRRWAHAE